MRRTCEGIHSTRREATSQLLPRPFRNFRLAFATLLLGLWTSTVVAQTVTGEFTIPTASNNPAAIVRGPDGNLWFTEFLGNKIGRLDLTKADSACVTDGSRCITEFPVPTAGARPFGIASGPDGNLWFTEQTANKIGRITPAGMITEFTVPTSGSSPTGIVAGPDGNLWFTESAGNKIGKITPTGGITEFPLTTPSSTPGGITLGPDGALWFTERGAVKVGRITTGGTLTDFAGFSTDPPIGITAASDGNLWVTRETGTRIGRITPATGTNTDFSIVGGTSSSSPFGIAGGPDLNIWLTGAANQIIRIRTDGTGTQFPVPTPNSGPQGIAANNPDGALWFTEFSGNKIGRITASACTPPGAPVSPKIAPLGNSNPNAPVTGIDYLNLSWSPPASGTTPATSYDWAIGGDPFSASTTATSATAPPRGSNSPITLHVRARGCAPEQPGQAADSPTYSPAPPVANFSASGPISAGASVTFTDTSQPQATSWLWLFGDGGSATTQSTTHTFANRGIYTVVLIASNGAGSSVKTNQQAVQSLRPLSLRAVPTTWFDSTDPGRRRLAGVRLAESSSTWLRISAPEEDAEVIVYLRFLDEEGNLVEERRLSIVPGQDALYDLAAYGLQGTYSLELVSTRRFTPSLVQLTADDEDRGKRDRE